MTKFALSIAASHTCGCAGIEADLRVMSALNVFGMSAITGGAGLDQKELKGLRAERKIALNGFWKLWEMI